MSRITQRLFEALANMSLESFRQSGCTAGSMERFQLSKAFHRERLRLGQRFDRHHFSVAQNLGRFAVFVDQTFDRENKLIVERRPRRLRQPAYINLQCVSLAADASQQLAAQNRRHAGRQPAIWRDRHPCGCCLVFQREFLLHHSVVAAQVGEVASGSNRRLG